MPVERLTARKVETVRARNGKRTEIRDAMVIGLELRVTTKGVKSWYFQYTRQSDGKRRRVLLGTYPAMSLEAARRDAIALRGEVERRKDPADERHALKTAMTFRELAELRLATDNRIGPGTRGQYKQALQADVFPAIGNLPATDVTADMVARILDVVEERGAAVHADRVRSAIGSTFKWAVKRRRAGISADPTVGLGKRAPAAIRTRVLSEEELARFWNAISAVECPLTVSMQLVMKLAILTGQRRAEVCGASSAELALDGPAPVWIIPGDSKRTGYVVKGRTKNRQTQTVPLSPQAVELWKEALQRSNGHEYVFPAQPGPGHVARDTLVPHLRPDSVSQAVRRLRDKVGIDDVRLHDMRRTMATWCGEQGIRPDVIDRILNHTPRDVTRRHYNFAGMETLVREALNAWALYVFDLTRRQADKSITFHLGRDISNTPGLLP